MTFKDFFAAGIKGNLLALMTGAVLTLAFAPLQWFPLAIIAPAVLFQLWQTVTPGRAFFRGWLFGLGFFGAGVYWVFISIHTFGNASFLLAGILTVGLIAILALFPALTGYFLNRYFPCSDRSRLFYAFPAIWVFLEWMRSWVFTGFPWLLLGYSQINSPLKGYAAVGGVYGLSLLVLISSGLLLQIVTYAYQRKMKETVLSCAIFLLIWAGGAVLNTVKWTTPFGKPITVSLIQGNIPQEVKWSPESIQPTLDTYHKLTEAHWGSSLIVWPESAVPIPLQSAEEFINALHADAEKHNVSLITGIPVHLPGTQNYYNAVIALGKGTGFYFKHRLVPFGEYTPLNQWFSKLLDVLHIPMSDFIAATDRPVPLLLNNNIRIAPFICYEIAFPERVGSADLKTNLLLTVSNDGWFGRSIAQAQHLEIAQMRAAEMRRPLLFVSNNGMTAIINAQGKVQAAAPPYETTVLTGTVQPMEGKTPWQTSRMDSILFFIILLIVFAIRDQRRIRKNNLKNNLK